MDDKIIAIYCLCDDLLQAMHHQEDPQRLMTDAEVLTTAFVAALSCRGNNTQVAVVAKEDAVFLKLFSEA